MLVKCWACIVDFEPALGYHITTKEMPTVDTTLKIPCGISNVIVRLPLCNFNKTIKIT